MNERILALLILFLIVGGILYRDGRWKDFFGTLNFSQNTAVSVPLTQEEFDAINDFHPNDELSTREYILAGVNAKSSQAEIYRYARTIESVATSSVLLIHSECRTEPTALRAPLGGGIIVKNTDSRAHAIRINAEDFLLASGTSSLVSGLFSSSAGLFSYYCDQQKGGVILTIPLKL